MRERTRDPARSANPGEGKRKTRSENDEHGPPPDGLLLDGAVIAFTGPRRHEEIAALVRHRGGVPYFAPTVEIAEEFDEKEFDQFVAHLLSGAFVALVFLTGQAARDFYRHCEERGKLEAAVLASSKLPVFARGTKALARARARGVAASYRTDTVAELCELLRREPIPPGATGVVQYGVYDESPAQALRSRGVECRELHLYRSSLPKDRGPVLRLFDDLAAGKVQVLSFTSAIGVYNLFALAREAGREEEVRGSCARVVLAATGPVTADALRDHGLEPQVVPEEYKLPAMVTAVAAHLRARRRPG